MRRRISMPFPYYNFRYSISSRKLVPYTFPGRIPTRVADTQLVKQSLRKFHKMRRRQHPKYVKLLNLPVASRDDRR